MNTEELNDIADKVLNGENVASEDLDRLKKAFEELGEKIAEYLENVFIPAFENLVKTLWDASNAYSSRRSQQTIKYKMLENQKPRPLYLDKRRRVHICRSHC